MNHGYFFRLNPLLSKVEDGICIFDYTDLPAYSGRSEDNLMSPKFPICVAITGSSVRFLVHYSAYKVAMEQEEGNKTKYYYDLTNVNTNKDITLGHMEEVIMELPYTNDATNNLSSTIQHIYSTRFPYTDDNTSYGGRFLEQAIIERYSSTTEEGESPNETGMPPSFSMLWLMDIVKNGYVHLDNNGHVEKFLRKLFLDFMFDLKHSNVFQNSIYYQQMYSGLMSDFYFSALMHKCEYYYYRILTRKAIVAAGEEIHETNTRKSITTLYAKELFQAESLWMEDIMSPQAEAFFWRNPPKNYYNIKGISVKIENASRSVNQFERWPSWFAEPEEEMKRVCFKTEEIIKEENKLVPHVCNADILVELLQLENDDQPSEMVSLSEEMVMLRNLYREKASKWFLKRYDFNDVLHLHFFKGANTVSIFLLISVLSWMIYKQSSASWFDAISAILTIIVAALVLIFIVVRVVPRLNKTVKQENYKEWGVLVSARNSIVKKRLLFQSICIVLMAIACFFVLHKVWLAIPVFLLLLLLWVFCSSYFFKLPKSDFVAKLHLLLPRAVASITLAWLTLSAGFDLYASFFDSTPSWTHAILISIIVFLFIMYDINRIIPFIPAWKKVLRSFESLIISYTISLIVGFFIIDFLGAKYMERSGVLEMYYKEYVNNTNNDGLIKEKITEDITTVRGMVNNLVNIYHKKDNNENLPIAVEWKPYENGLKFYILPNFLIMFAFIAMFMGIFIQLIVFGDNRQITEF